MHEIDSLIFENFNTLFFFAVVWVVGWFAWLTWRRRKRGLFPTGTPEDVVYEEKTASGRSHKNWYCRIGGAQNCLRIVVTKSELWVTPIFPFSALAGIFDLDHRVMLDKIQSVSQKSGIGRNSILITFLDAAMEVKTIELTPRDSDTFLHALLKEQHCAA